MWELAGNEAHAILGDAVFHIDMRGIPSADGCDDFFTLRHVVTASRDLLTCLLYYRVEPVRNKTKGAAGTFNH